MKWFIVYLLLSLVPEVLTGSDGKCETNCDDKLSAMQREFNLKTQRMVENMAEMEENMAEMKTEMLGLRQEIVDQKNEINRLKIKVAEQRADTEVYNEHKRSDDFGSLEPIVTQLSQKVNTMDADLQAVKNINTVQDHTLQGIGSVYVRWGNNACPNSSETLYSGYVGGSAYSQPGGGANYLCLTPHPVFDSHPIPRYGVTELFGAEYETCNEPQCDMSVVCSVCRTPRSTTLMIPGTNVCQPGWHMEYAGYLMADDEGQASNSEFVCVDSARDYLPGTQGDQNGALFYYTEVTCGSLSCPPYQHGRLVTCVVCSK